MTRLEIDLETLVAWRRDLHRHPELAYEEHRTAAFVAERLHEFGLDEVHTGLAGTGVVGVLRAGRGNDAIGLRADMDALPITEASGVPWASARRGLMHACGHDGHTAMLLGAAWHLARTRRFEGTVYFIFQPAEEGRAGARRMIEDGLFARFPMRAVFGLHNWPWLPLGEFGVHRGEVMAAADRFEIRLRGRGCHAAMPHLGRDPVVAVAALIQVLQSLISRETDPLRPAVLSVTRIRAGDAFNVVPDEAECLGTVRIFDPALRARIRARMAEVVDHVAAAHGCSGSLDYREGYPPTVNSAAEAEEAAAAAAAVAGAERVHHDPPPSMGAEDFAFMLEQKPGAYVWMGIGGAQEGRILHSPRYDFDDRALETGVAYWVELVERLLPRRAAAR